MTDHHVMIITVQDGMASRSALATFKSEMAAFGVSVVYLPYSRSSKYSPEIEGGIHIIPEHTAPVPAPAARVTIAGGGAAPVPAHPKPAPARRSISPLARQHMSLAQLARRKKERAARKKAKGARG